MHKVVGLILLFHLTCLPLIYTQCDFPALFETSYIENSHRTQSLKMLGMLTDYEETEYFKDQGVDLFQIGYSSSFWFSALDGEGNLQVAANQYANTANYDFIAGPYVPSDNGNNEWCEFYTRTWKATSLEIRILRSAFANGSLEKEEIPVDILEWPALGNEEIGIFGENQGYALAPFYDYNQDGMYDPMLGDYPIVLSENPFFLPHQFMVSFYNDGYYHKNTFGDRLNIEVLQIDYVLDCPQTPEINQCIFTRAVVRNRSAQAYEPLTIGLWEDNTLDCYDEDKVGCNVGLNATYTYNKDGIENYESCPFLADILDAGTPLHSKLFLSHPIEGFMATSSGKNIEVSNINSPSSPEGYHNLLKGRWNDGTPLTFGGSGYNLGSTDTTLFIFPDSPLDSLGWSMQHSDSINFYDIRTLTTLHSSKVDVGETVTIDFADFVFYDKNKEGLGVFEDWENAVILIKEAFEGFKTDFFPCASVSSVTPDPESFEFQIFPNPSSEIINVEFPDHLASGQIELINFDGKHIESYTINSKFSTFSVGELPIGIYLLRVRTVDGRFSTKRFLKS